MKKIKPVIQNDLKDCGVCCMQWIIKYYDGFISLEKLREDTFTNSFGTTAFHIVNTFKKWNFDSMGVLEKDITNKELKFPLIAHLILDNGLEHFVIVTRIYNNTVYLMDPSVGYKKTTIKEFKKIFSGNIILVYPRSKIIKLENNLTINELFFNILNKEKFLVIKIFVTSILWTLFTILCGYYLKIGSNILNEDITLLKYLIITFGVFTFLKIIIFFIRNYYENHLNNLVDVYLYPEFLNHLFFLPLKNINSRSTGEIMTRVEELSNIKNLFSDIFVSCFLDSIIMFVSIIILFLINKEMSFILFVFLVVYGFLGYFFSKISYRKVLENIEYQTDFNSKLIESIDMINSIKHLNIVDKILNKLEYSLSKYFLNNFQFNSFFNTYYLIKDFMIEFCVFIINSYGLFKVVNGEMNIVDLFTFNILLSYCIDPVKNIINLLPKYNYIKASYSKITEFINIEEEKYKNNAEVFNGDIVFKNVSFSYNNYDYILKDVSFCIKKDSHVLLNGPSGCGKSTICKLLYKECELTNGEVYIGYKNLLDINIDSIRTSILYVSQKENLFLGTIKENIDSYRNVDNDLFYKVCEICKIDDILSKKALRYDAVIEPSFNNLSGGEKQRIILARGLLKNADIIILDEALSEVDKKLEDEIIKNIRRYYFNKTIIYISHKNQKNNFENVIELGEINGLF